VVAPSIRSGTLELENTEGDKETLEFYPLASVFSEEGGWTELQDGVLSTTEGDYGSFMRDLQGTMVTVSRGGGSRVAIRYPRTVTPNGVNIGSIQIYSCCGNDLTDEWAPVSKPLGGSNAGESFEFVAMADKEPWFIVEVRYTTEDKNGRYQVYSLGDDQELHPMGAESDAGSSNTSPRCFRTTADISFDGSVIAVGIVNPGGSSCLAIHNFLWSSATNSYSQMGSDINIDFDCPGSGSGSINFALSYRGDVLAVAYVGGGPENEGYVRFYNWVNHTSNWVQLSEDLYGASRNGQFGFSISFDQHRTVAISEPSYGAGSTLGAGRVTVFELVEGSNSFEPVGNSIVGTRNYERFGRSVVLSLSGDGLVVGAIENGGRIDIYELD
jgi:hypothetical protein